MSAGLLVFLAVLLLAVLLAPPLIRPRMRASRRRLDLEAADRRLMERIHRDLLAGPLMTFGGMPVFTSRLLPHGVEGVIMQAPSLLAAPPMVSVRPDIRADLERARALVLEVQRIETLVMRPEALVKIVGI